MAPGAKVRFADDSADVVPGTVVDHEAADMLLPGDDAVLVRWSRNTLAWEHVAALVEVS